MHRHACGRLRALYYLSCSRCLPARHGVVHLGYRRARSHQASRVFYASSAAATVDRTTSRLGRAEAAPAHAVWRMCQLRLPGRGRLCAVPELPPAFEEPMPEVRSCARSFVDRLSVLRNAASRHRRSSQRSNYRRAEAGCAPGECRGSWPGTAPVSADLVCNPALRKAACAALLVVTT